MTRLEIRQRFRQENPEVTERVKSDDVLNSWLLEGNLQFCCATRIIQETGTFTSVADDDGYNLVDELSKFYEIDEFPGGGVAYNGKRIELTTKAKLDNESLSWRSRDSGTPKSYYRRGPYLYFDRPPDSAVTVTVDYAALPDDFDDDTKKPFNQLAHLQVYSYGLVLYLQGRAKMAIGKDEDKARAMVEYAAYVEWCIKQVQGGKMGKIQFVPSDVPSYRGSADYR